MSTGMNGTNFFLQRPISASLDIFLISNSPQTLYRIRIILPSQIINNTIQIRPSDLPTDLFLNGLRVHDHFIRHFFVLNLSITGLVSVVWEMAMGNRKRFCDKGGKDTATWVVLLLNVISTFHYLIVARTLSDLTLQMY